MMRLVGTWGEVGPGDYVLAPSGAAYLIEAEVNGWLKMHDRDGNVVTFVRPADHALVDRLVPTEADSMTAVQSILGAVLLTPEQVATLTP